MNASNQISLFYAYAHTDANLRDKLDDHLTLLRKGGFISQWYDRDISAGTEWNYQIDEHLNTADIILLLISADFLASDYADSMMRRALVRQTAGKARVIPILLRPVDWQEAPFKQLQILPQNGRPVTSWRDRNLAFKHIAIQIRKAVKELQELLVIIPPPTSVTAEQALSEFRRCQKTVSELKSVHNMLHEIEKQLEGLSAAIQLFTRDEREKKKSSLRKEIFEYIDIAWSQAVLRIDDLVYFATEEMKILEDERLNIDSDVVRGAPWVKELFILQRPFETMIEEQDINGVKNLSNALLRTCRTHLYRIDKRLLEAVKELDLSAELMIKRYRM